jgi:hypothetical protein
MALFGLGQNAKRARTSHAGIAESSLYSEPALPTGSVADRAFAITVDALGSAYVKGETQSPDFPVQNAFQDYKGGHDAFVARLEAAGFALIYSTFGSSDDTGAGITVDSAGNAYVAGDPDSADFPIVSGFQTAKVARI